MSTISFGKSDGVTGAPTIDGFIDHDFIVLPPALAEPGEPGYTNGFRRTFDGGTLSPVILQGVRVATGDRLVIGVLARFDSSWDDNDQVIIALKPTPGSGQGQARMLVIRPVISGVGVDAGVGTGLPYFIKTNVALPPSRWDLYTGNASGTPWTPVSGGLPDIVIKVRSWQPGAAPVTSDEKAWSLEISMPRLASGNANWLDLADGFGAYINVLRVNPEFGAVQNTFPDAKSLPDDSNIDASLEIPAYGTAFIPDLQMPPGSNPGLGIFFPNGPLSIGVRPVGDMGAPASNIRGSSSPDTRENEILAIVRNTGPNVSGIQATFAFANWGLGTQWTTPATLPTNPTTASGTITSWPDAGAELPLTTVWTRAQVSAAGFGPPNDHQCMTATLSAISAVNFVQVATRRNMDFISLSEHEREAEINTEGLPVPPGGAAEHDILLRSFARKIRLADVVLGIPDASEGALFAAEGVGRRQDTLSRDLVAVASGALSTGAAGILERYQITTEDLFQGRVSAEVRRAFAKSIEDHVAIVWFTEGLRRTGTTLTINGTTYENLAAELGSFGYIPHHVGLADNFSWSITGDGITRIAPGLLRIRVRRGEVARLKVRIAMSRDERPGDISDVPIDPDWKPGGKPPRWPKWWCLLVAAIIIGVILLVLVTRP